MITGWPSVCHLTSARMASLHPWSLIKLPLISFPFRPAVASLWHCSAPFIRYRGPVPDVQERCRMRGAPPRSFSLSHHLHHPAKTGHITVTHTPHLPHHHHTTIQTPSARPRRSDMRSPLRRLPPSTHSTSSHTYAQTEANHCGFVVHVTGALVQAPTTMECVQRTPACACACCIHFRSFSFISSAWHVCLS